jgi:hypothetical protein
MSAGRGRFSSFALALVFLVTASLGHAGHVYEGLDLRSGKPVSILRDEPSKKGSVVVFMSAKCPCSLSHVDEIKKLATDYPEFRFIGVNANADESVEFAKPIFSAFPFVVLKDERSLLADELKAVKTPHAFIFDSSGHRVFQGGVSNSATFARADRKYLREALEDLMLGREIRTPLARALGCSIERTSK